MFQTMKKTHKGLVSREQPARDFFENSKMSQEGCMTL